MTNLVHIFQEIRISRQKTLIIKIMVFYSCKCLKPNNNDDDDYNTVRTSHLRNEAYTDNTKTRMLTRENLSSSPLNILSLFCISCTVISSHLVHILAAANYRSCTRKLLKKIVNNKVNNCCEK
jgi:hypothetical protein